MPPQDDSTNATRFDPAHDNMFFAIASGDVERTHRILEYRRDRRDRLSRAGGASPGTADQPVVGNWPLHFALMNCKTNLPDMVALLVEFGSSPNGTVLTSPGTPLALALAHQLASEVVVALLKGGANVNGDPEGRQIPLHWCARAARLDTCRLLLENGADWRQRDRQNETAEEVAEIRHGAGAPITQMLRAVREAEELEAGKTMTEDRREAGEAASNRKSRKL